MSPGNGADHDMHDPVPSYQAEVARPDPVAPIATPNASSTPVWSLTGDHAETVSRPRETIAQAVVLPPSEDEQAGAADAAVAQRAPEGPAKKGWWQRTFRSDG
jgi:hypothetical protein